jgi:FkbM family methyltransferase
MQSAVERWQEMIDARARQMDAAYARLGRTSADYWSRRARGYHRSTSETVGNDPFYRKLRQVVTHETTVLDVGAGTGRFALALAPLAKQVIAVEPNENMLSYLREDAKEQGITNISYSRTTWQDAPDDLQAELTICSHVVYPIRDIVPFLTKIDASARQACYIYVRVTPIDTLTAPIWRHFHGDDRHMSPGAIHLLDVLYEMGIYPDVEIARMPGSLRFPSVEIAAQELSEQLLLPDDPQTRDELINLLREWLVPRDGMLVPPLKEMVVAIVSWPNDR